jgi:hypothetical protein
MHLRAKQGQPMDSASLCLVFHMPAQQAAVLLLLQAGNLGPQ